EMRSQSFEGFINEGDQVRVYGEWKEGQTVRAERVYNLTHQSMVKTPKSLRDMVSIVALGFFAFSFLLIIIPFIVAVVTRSPNAPFVSAGGFLLPFLLPFVIFIITIIAIIKKRRR